MILVASYCRVSTEKDDQANSFEAQQRYFKEYIDRQPDWELYRVYADEGITGTSTKKRVEFNRMISDAQMGKFKLIITKEVSRFSRNILDTIRYTRELKSNGVGVVFMNDGISTLEPDAELRLSIMGSIAQEESRKTSSRVKWGQTRQMERGVVFGRSLLGYDVKEGRITINPEGAELVRLIFHKYGVEKKGTSVIARELREKGYRTYQGNTTWRANQIIKILRNEKYVGDLVQKKTYTPDYLTHAKKYNNGAEEKICLLNHHEAIIDRELWNVVQSELAKQNKHNQQKNGHSNRYVFSGKIRCGACGTIFVSRTKKYKNGNSQKRWACFTATNEGSRHVDTMGNEVGCSVGRIISDVFATEILRTAIDAVKLNAAQIIGEITLRVEKELAKNEQGGVESAEKLEYEIAQVKKRKEAVLDAFFRHEVTKEEMRLMNDKYDLELEALKTKLQAAREYSGLVYDTSKLRQDIRQYIKQICQIEELDEPFLKNVLDQMTIFHDYRVELRLNLIPQKWRFVLDSIYDIRSRLQNGKVCSFDTSVSEPTAQSTKKPVIPTVFDDGLHYDSSVSDQQQVEKSLDLQGFSDPWCHFDSSVPTSGSKWNHNEKKP